MLKLFFHGQLQLGFAQAGVAALAALVVVLLARRRRIHLETEALIAMARGLVQIIAVGSILVILLRAPRWTSAFLLAAMIVAAGATSARRAKGMPQAFRISSWSIAFGAGSVIALMTSLGVIDTAITSLVPVGSMLIANAMNTNGLALNRFRSDVLAHVGEIETALALGADARESVSPYVQASFEASLIPGDRLDTLSWHRMDSGFDGRHVTLRCSTRVCGHLPVRGAGHDFRGFGIDLVDQHTADSGHGIYAGRTTALATWAIIALQRCLLNVFRVTFSSYEQISGNDPGARQGRRTPSPGSRATRRGVA